MEILEIILPVLVMVILGMACRKGKLLTQSGIDNMKILVTNIMLPVAIFHARQLRNTARKRNPGVDHVCDAGDLIWNWIFAEAVYGRDI